jgi:hypothetical protein
MNPDQVKAIAAELARPFKAEDVHWKAQTTTKDKKRALAVPYLTARNVMDRLDQVLGLDGWQDQYQEAGSAVVCTLRCRFGDVWIQRSDAGGMAESIEEGDKLKSACSDALKRAAVKFGIGRYLYDVAGEWCDFDAEKKKLVNPPRHPLVKGEAMGAAEAIAVVPGDWLKGVLKGKPAQATALCKFAGVGKLGQAHLAWFPWIRDLVKAQVPPATVAEDYLGGRALAEMKEDEITAAYAKWLADRKGR